MHKLDIIVYIHVSEISIMPKCDRLITHLLQMSNDRVTRLIGKSLVSCLSFCGKRVPLHIAFIFSSVHRPDMTEILLRGTQIASHLSIHRASSSTLLRSGEYMLLYPVETHRFGKTEPNIVELQRLEHLWKHKNMLETWVVRANECKS